MLNETKTSLFLHDIPDTLTVAHRDREYHFDCESVQMSYVGRMFVDSINPFFNDPDLVKAIDIHLRRILMVSVDLSDPDFDDMIEWDRNYSATLPFDDETDDEDEKAFEDYLTVCKAILSKLGRGVLERFLREMHQYEWMDTLIEDLSKKP